MKHGCLVVVLLFLTIGAHAAGFKIYIGESLQDVSASLPTTPPGLESLFLSWNWHHAYGNASKLGIGVGIDFPLSSHTQLEIGLVYQRQVIHIQTQAVPKFWVYDSPILIWNSSWEYKAHILAIPLLFKLAFIGSESPYLSVGGMATYSLFPKAAIEGDIMLMEPSTPLEQPLDPKTKPFNIGPLLGIGVQFEKSTYSILFEMRTFIGLLDFAPDLPWIPSLRTYTISLFGGVRWQRKRAFLMR